MYNILINNFSNGFLPSYNMTPLFENQIIVDNMITPYINLKNNSNYKNYLHDILTILLSNYIKPNHTFLLNFNLIQELFLFLIREKRFNRKGNNTYIVLCDSGMCLLSATWDYKPKLLSQNPIRCFNILLIESDFNSFYDIQV